MPERFVCNLVQKGAIYSSFPFLYCVIVLYKLLVFTYLLTRWRRFRLRQSTAWRTWLATCGSGFLTGGKSDIPTSLWTIRYSLAMDVLRLLGRAGLRSLETVSTIVLGTPAKVTIKFW